MRQQGAASGAAHEKGVAGDVLGVTDHGGTRRDLNTLAERVTLGRFNTSLTRGGWITHDTQTPPAQFRRFLSSKPSLAYEILRPFVFRCLVSRTSV